MDNGRLNKRILSSNNIIKTLKKVSQLHSSSSSFSSQSNYSSCLNNNDVYQKFHYIPRKLSIKSSKKLPRVNDKKLKKLHDNLVQLEWNNYIQWKILLTFSLVLWILLCITDKILLRSPSKDKITKAPQSIPEPNKFTKWISGLYSSICHAINNVSNLSEAYTFALLIGIFICIETKLRKKWKNTQENWTQCEDLTLKLSNSTDNKLTIELLNNQYQDIGKKLSVLPEKKSEIENLEFKKLIIDPDLYWQLQMADNFNEMTYIKNTQDSLKQLEVIKQVNEDNERIYHLNELNTKNICYCDSKSFVETYDLKISKFINYGNKQTVTFDKSTDTQLDRSSRIKFKKSVTKKSILKLKSKRPSLNKIKTDRLSTKFISSSPAFKKFLLKLNDTNPFDSILNL